MYVYTQIHIHTQVYYTFDQYQGCAACNLQIIKCRLLFIVSVNRGSGLSESAFAQLLYL